MMVLTLKNLARERGLHGYSRLRKSDLLENSENQHHLENLQEKSGGNWQEREVYSMLKKSELLQRLRAPRDQILLDQDIDARVTNVPFLTPTPYVPPQQATPTPSSMLKN